MDCQGGIVSAVHTGIITMYNVNGFHKSTQPDCTGSCNARAQDRKYK